MMSNVIMPETIRAAWVIARRDFTAIIFSKAFLWFLLGPLFPVLVGAGAGMVGSRAASERAQPTLGIALSAAETAAAQKAHAALVAQLGEEDLPAIRVLETSGTGQKFDAIAALAVKGEAGKTPLSAVWTGSLASPVLTGPESTIEAWQGVVGLISAQARSTNQAQAPPVALRPQEASAARENNGRVVTAQMSQALLFLLTMLLAGMVLSNLVEEKANKIIEVLAAAVPVDAIFLGKLSAMLGMALLGILVWSTVFGGLFMLGGSALPALPVPAVGWPMFLLLGFVYFAMAYLLLGSLMMGIGSQANSVREVQTISMPVTMAQMLVFFFASYAVTKLGQPIELASVAFPFSSPFAMLARAAQQDELWQHLLAVAWQAIWVLLLIRIGAAMFRKRVMQSGPRKAKGRYRWGGKSAESAIDIKVS